MAQKKAWYIQRLGELAIPALKYLLLVPGSGPGYPL